MPDKAHIIEHYRGRSYLQDLVNKADFARAYATSFDEYSALLGVFRIDTRVEKENISYLYPGQKRWKRGSNLHVNYDKEGLVKTFRANDLKFQAHPELKAMIGAEMDTLLKSGARTPGVNNVHARQEKDYARFTRRGRGSEAGRFPHENELSSAAIKITDIYRASRMSIPDYCQKNKIALSIGPKGETTLEGRAYVQIHGDMWINNKNKTRGTLIEFVAAHKNLTLLQSAAELSGNTHLLAFESAFGEVPRKYTSFYVPKDKQADQKTTKAKLESLLRSSGANPKASEHIYQRGQVQVNKEGQLFLFPHSEDEGALEYGETKPGEWKQTKRGKFKKPFFAHPGRKNEAHVYSDLMTYVKSRGLDLFREDRRGRGILALMEPDAKVVETYAKQNSHLKKLFLVTWDEKKMSEVELDLFNNLKHRLAHAGVVVEPISFLKALSRSNHSLSR